MLQNKVITNPFTYL